jgi:hypothetical protein
MRNTILQKLACVEDCANRDCEEVKELRINNFNSYDSIGFSWSGSGNFITRYKIIDSLNYDINNIKEVSGNNVTVKNLQPCTLYKFEVQKICSNSSLGRITSIVFNSSGPDFKVKPVNSHGDLYDLQLDCKHCSAKDYFIKVDQVSYSADQNASFQTLILKDLFADGARHRIDLSKDSSSKACNRIYFQAPYYRLNSQKILSADFNDCSMPAGWKDSVILANPAFSSPIWYIEESNYYTIVTNRGSLDSTCMIYYSNYNNVNKGTLGLVSPVLDLTHYRDVKLHFDYNFLSYKVNDHDFTSFMIEAFNGNSWEKIMEYVHNDPSRGSLIFARDIWDSLPQRIFIDLDKYRNKNFQLRFIVDDGFMKYNVSRSVLIAFDNIQIDGYLKDSSDADEFIVYPNPTREEIFIQFSQTMLADITYNLTDANGRIVDKGHLNNYRISLKGLSPGMYFIHLYQSNHVVGNTKKIVKQ